MTSASHSAADELPIRRLGIAGLGLMGGSVALAARAAWPAITIVGFDRPVAVAAARERGCIDEVVSDPCALAETDLVVLAVPLDAMAETMAAITEAVNARRTVVTDVGSIKRPVMAAAKQAGLGTFVGGHPMAGSERGGLGEARADLFRGRPWLLVRGDAPAYAASRVEHFAAMLGGEPHWMEAAAHDRAVAYVSHLPQVLAVALMNTADACIGDDRLTAGGRAFDEMTRLASSPPDMWEQIFGANAEFVAEALAEFVARLPRRDDLERVEWVRRAFDEAAASRARGRGPASST
jgi:prephenate dehydrogenase